MSLVQPDTAKVGEGTEDPVAENNREHNFPAPGRSGSYEKGEETYPPSFVVRATAFGPGRFFSGSSLHSTS